MRVTPMVLPGLCFSSTERELVPGERSRQTVEVSVIGRGSGCCRRAFEQQPAKLEPILVLPDQFAQVLTAGGVASLANLFIHERLQALGQGNVHRAHGRRSDALAKFGKPVPVTRDRLANSASNEPSPPDIQSGGHIRLATSSSMISVAPPPIEWTRASRYIRSIGDPATKP